MPSDRPQVRAFLSSTFSDFQEERDLLAKQVFPALRQKAKGRGVEVVDVDLRWGITEEQSQQGQTLPICLAEIENCRPYFIGLLGERYGWVPEPDQYSPELLERQGWLREHQGGASVTELEILHGVLNNPEMAGRALFYFRDPAYSTARAEAGEPGWRSEGEQERQKLEALKQRIRASGFPVVECLADPQTIAARIEADLWALIERQFPEGEQPDALAIEAARHASYRADRTGLYLGGESYIQQLEQWIDAGEQRLLITGDSGSGKSALIANWMAAREQRHPGDVIYSHHLGCSNDANAVRPLLARLIDTAAQLIEEDIQVPQDWWELVAAVGETLARLSLWARRRGTRWIWVLDGLDKLSAEDQQALPWLPVTLPEGIHVVTSALDCPARTILQERDYRSLTIGPLQRPEQEALIDRYLRIFSRQLDAGLKEQLLAHPLAGSPLFLRVLLEELRQCGRFDTLKQQLDVYLSAQTIDDLYERVLERLEADGHGEAVQKALTALWASRAGLSEPELLAITGLTPAAWAPIGIGLQAALGESKGRLVFGHDFLRTAVRDRYLPTEDHQRQTHSNMADWFEARDGWDERDSEELPWQLQQAKRLDELRDWLLQSSILATLVWDRSSREVMGIWRIVQAEGDGELDEAISADVTSQINLRRDDPADQAWFIDQIADLLNEAGLYRELLVELRTLSLRIQEENKDSESNAYLICLAELAKALHNLGDFKHAYELYHRSLQVRVRLLGAEDPGTVASVCSLADLCRDKGDYDQAEELYSSYLEVCGQSLGFEHPLTLRIISGLAQLYLDKGDYEQAQRLARQSLETQERVMGIENIESLLTVNILAVSHYKMGDYGQAEALFRRALTSRERLQGSGRPSTVTSMHNLASLYLAKGDYGRANDLYELARQSTESLLGPNHLWTITTVNNLGLLRVLMGDHEKAKLLLQRALDVRERHLGFEHTDTLTTVANLVHLYLVTGDYGEGVPLAQRGLEACARLLGPSHPDTLELTNTLATIFLALEDYDQAEGLLRHALESQEQALGPRHPSTLSTMNNLAILLSYKGAHEQAETLLLRTLDISGRELGADHPSTLSTVVNLAQVYKDMNNYKQAIALAQRALGAQEQVLGPAHPLTVSTVGTLAGLLLDQGEHEEAEVLYKRVLETREQMLSPMHPDTNATRLRLANLCSDQDRYDESIPLRRVVLQVATARDGHAAPRTLASMSHLAEDLYFVNELHESEQLYREALHGHIAILGGDDGATMAIRYGLARTLSALGRYKEAIELRRIELAWRRQQNGDLNPCTLDSINMLAIDLRQAGDLEEAELLFRELIAAQEQVLDPGAFEIGSALGDLAVTLERSSRGEEALLYEQQVLDHRIRFEGADSWHANSERLSAAWLLGKLGRSIEALALLDQLQLSLERKAELDDNDRNLLKDAAKLTHEIRASL